MRNSPFTRWSIRTVAACAVAYLALGCDVRSDRGNLLADRAPSRWAGAFHPEKLTDGTAAAEGAAWNDTASAILAPELGFVQFDLGASVQLGDAVVQAHSGCRYELESSLDETHWTSAWVLEAENADAGQRSYKRRLQGVARHLRLRASSCHNPAALTELQIYPPGALAPARLTAAPPKTLPELELRLKGAARAKLAVGALAMLVFAWALRERRRSGRQLWFERLALGCLVLLGALAWRDFDVARAKPVPHIHDDFHYYLGAKYARELGYTRLYACALRAEQENQAFTLVPGRSARDLSSNRRTSMQAVLEQGRACPARFGAQRWHAFKRDVAWLQAQINPKAWSEIFVDHGYNATPIWTLAFAACSSTPKRAPASWARSPGSIPPSTALSWPCSGRPLACGPWRSPPSSGASASLGWPSGRTAASAAAYGSDCARFRLVAARRGRSASSGVGLGAAAGVQLLPGALGVGAALAVANGLRRGASVATPLRMLCAAVVTAAVLFGAVYLRYGSELLAEFAANTAKHATLESQNTMGLKTALTRLDAWDDDASRAASDFAAPSPWIMALRLGMVLLLAAATMNVRPAWAQMSIGFLWLIPIVEIFV